MSDSETDEKGLVVHCWSAPRSRSTALMYAFESRTDCYAIDEPLYRRWLKDHSGSVERPYTHQLLNGVNDDTKQWNREQTDLQTRLAQANNNNNNKNKNNNTQQQIIYCKHMAKHSYLYDFSSNCEIPGNDKTTSTSDSNSHDDNGWKHVHVLLIRDPVSIISSWDCASEIHGNNCTPDEIGIVSLLQIYSQLQTNQNDNVIVLDSDALATNPESTLQQLCQDLHIPFDPAMLTWPSGPHECDGPVRRRSIKYNDIFFLSFVSMSSFYNIEF